MYHFENVKTDTDGIARCTSLLKEVFPSLTDITCDYIRWQYADNPCGQIVGFNAFFNEKLVAHYVAQPFVARINGEVQKGLLSLNTATHPEHQGKKLFTTLAEKTYEYAFSQGYAFVIGVANANSTPGFLRKLGFQHVAPLTVKLGWGKIHTNPQEKPFTFEHVWDAETIGWRLRNPRCTYNISEKSVFTSAKKFGIKALMGFFEKDILEKCPQNKNRLYKPVTLYLGLDSSINWQHGSYFNLPKQLKPSPLNLIFRDLTGNNLKLDPQNIKFQTIDFDAY